MKIKELIEELKKCDEMNDVSVCVEIPKGVIHNYDYVNRPIINIDNLEGFNQIQINITLKNGE